MHESREPREMPATNSVAGRREKAQATRPACTFEESHSGIVPMSHSNKDGTWLAESVEGRLLIKENTYPSCTYPTQSGSARGSRVGDVRTGCRFAYSSEIRTGCSNERPSGSVRGGQR